MKNSSPSSSKILLEIMSKLVWYKNHGCKWKFRTLELTRKYLEKVTTTKIKEEIETMSPEIRTKLKNTELRLKVGGGYANLHEYEMSSLSNLVKSVRTRFKSVRRGNSLTLFSIGWCYCWGGDCLDTESGSVWRGGHREGRQHRSGGQGTHQSILRTTSDGDYCNRRGRPCLLIFIPESHQLPYLMLLYWLYALKRNSVFVW